MSYNGTPIAVFGTPIAVFDRHFGRPRVCHGTASNRPVRPAVARWCWSEVTTLAGSTGIELVEGRVDDLAVGLPDALLEPKYEAFCRDRYGGLLEEKIIPRQRFAKRPAAIRA